MKKKLLSLLLVIAVMMTSVSMGFGTLVATAGAAGGGVEAINAFSLVQNSNATGTSFSTTITIKSKASGYQIRVNTITPTIRYYQNEQDVLTSVSVSYTQGTVVGTGGQNFNVTGSISANLAGLIRYECNYDLLDSNGNVKYAGMTGYGYGAVSANGQQTGALGSNSGEPSEPGDRYKIEDFVSINSVYVQQSSLTLTSRQRTTKNAIEGASSVTRTMSLSGTFPSTITVRDLKWDYVEMYGEKDVYTTWFEMNSMPNGYFNFTVNYNGSAWKNVQMYYRSDSARDQAKAIMNQYLGYGLEKSYYTADSWNYYLYILDLTAIVALGIPGPNYAFQKSCIHADDAAAGGYIAGAVDSLVFANADYTDVNNAYNELIAIKDNKATVKTYSAGAEGFGSTTIPLYKQEAIDNVTIYYTSCQKNLYRYQQETVDGYAATIRDMTKNLDCYDADFTYLDIAIAEYDNMDKSMYSTKTLTAYELAVNSGRSLSRSLKANSQGEINTRLEAIVNAKKALEYRDAETEYLQEQMGITEVIFGEYDNGTLFTEEEGFDTMWTLLNEAYNEAVAAKDLTIDKQDDVDAVAYKLEYINGKMADYRSLDTKPLNAELQIGAEYAQEYYVAASYNAWNVLKVEGYTFINKAKLNYTGDDRKTYADLDEMNRLIELIRTARENLEKIKANFDALNVVVAQIPSETELALYKKEYVDAVTAAVDKIDYGATFDRQEEVNGWKTELEAALANLVPENYKDADYSGVEAAIALAESFNRDDFENYNIVDEAIAAVDYTKKIVDQAEVDAMAKAIRDAVAMLGYKLADYTDVYAAIDEARAVDNQEWYSNYNRIDHIIDNINWNITLEDQEIVDGYAASIRQAIEDLKLADADYTEVNKALSAARNLEPLSDFEDEFVALYDEAVNAVEAGYTINRQAEVDAMATRIYEVIALADNYVKPADYSRLNVAKEYAEKYNTGEYKNYDETVGAAIAAIDWDLKCRDTADKEHVKIMQDQIQAIYDAVKLLRYKDADYSAVYAAIDAARATYENNENLEYPYSQESIDAVEAVIDSIYWEYEVTNQSIVDSYVIQIEQAVLSLKYARADYSAVDAIMEEYNDIRKNKDKYVSISALENYIAKINWDYTVKEKDQVAKIVEDIRGLIDALEYAPADYARITNTENEFRELIRANRNHYYETDIQAVETALENVQYGLSKEFQDDVDAMADAVDEAFDNLKSNMKPADLTALYSAEIAANKKYNDMVASGYAVDDDTWYDLQNELSKVKRYGENTKIKDQAAVDSLTASIIAATENLEYKFFIDWEKTGLLKEGSGNEGAGSFIYGFEEGTVSADVRDQIVFVGAAELKIYETINGFGTGTTIKFVSTKDGKTLAEYTVAVFGDANGDAVVDTFDLAYALEVANSGEDADAVTLKVLDIDRDGYLTALDITTIIALANMDYTIMQDGSMETY